MCGRVALVSPRPRPSAKSGCSRSRFLGPGNTKTSTGKIILLASRLGSGQLPVGPCFRSSGRIVIHNVHREAITASSSSRDARFIASAKATSLCCHRIQQKALATYHPWKPIFQPSSELAEKVKPSQPKTTMGGSSQRLTRKLESR